MNQIRWAILEKMGKLDLTVYQVSIMVRNKVPQRTVYAFLAGEKDTSTETASALMDALGLAIKSISDRVTFLEGKVMDTESNMVKIFLNDDEGYKNWLERNPDGFVVNSYARPSPEYLVLHRSRCWTISTPMRTNWTTTGFIKICAHNKRELRKWARKEVGGSLHSCRICDP